MRRSPNTLLSLVLSIFGLTSCSSILTSMYGIKETKLVDEKTITRFAKDFGIPASDNFELDTLYLTYLFSFDTSKYMEEIRNHYQPLQALYYDPRGSLTSFQVNCYAGGFPNLKWNRNEIMTTFPPKIQAPLDSLVPLKTQLKYVKPLSGANHVSTSDFDFVVIVYWNVFMGRQSKRLIRYVQENQKLAGDKKVRIIYVNTDNLFAKKLRKNNK